MNLNTAKRELHRDEGEGEGLFPPSYVHLGRDLSGFGLKRGIDLTILV